MKVVYLTSWKESNDGGAGIVAFEIARSAVAYGITTAIIHPGSKTERYFENGLVHFSVQSHTDNDASYPKLTPGTVRKIFNFLTEFDPDIIHTHHEGFLGMVAEIWAIRHNRKFIATCHMLPTKVKEWLPASKASGYMLDLVNKTGFTRAILRDFYKNCNALIGLNSYSIGDIKQFGYKGEVWQISNGRNLQQFLSLKIPEINSYIYRLVFIGQIHRRKNQLFLIKMLHYLPENYHLKIVGSFTDQSLIEEINQLIIKYNLASRVEITGILPYLQIPKILEQSQLFVSASKVEVQSLSVIEAMAAGKPIVGLANETLDELIDDSVGRKLAKDTSPQDFAKAVVEFMNESESYNKKANAARLRVSDMDWSNVIKQTALKYQELLAKPNIKVQKSSLVRMIAKIPNKKLKTFLLTKVDKGVEVEKKKKMRIPTLIIVGLSLIGSVLVYVGWKIVIWIRPRPKE